MEQARYLAEARQVDSRSLQTQLNSVVMQELASAACVSDAQTRQQRTQYFIAVSFSPVTEIPGGAGRGEARRGGLGSKLLAGLALLLFSSLTQFEKERRRRRKRSEKKKKKIALFIVMVPLLAYIIMAGKKRSFFLTPRP